MEPGPHPMNEEERSMQLYAHANHSDPVSDATTASPDWVSCDEDEHAREIHRRLVELGQAAVESRSLPLHDHAVRLTGAAFLAVYPVLDRAWGEGLLRRQLGAMRDVAVDATNWPDVMACLDELVDALDALIDHRDGLHGDGSGDVIPPYRPAALEVLS
jgi:hypothetical protein